MQKLAKAEYVILLYCLLAKRHDMPPFESVLCIWLSDGFQECLYVFFHALYTTYSGSA
jgi:hypothetical protein